MYTFSYGKAYNTRNITILSKSHTNPDFLAQLAHLQKFVFKIEGVSGVRMRSRCNKVAIFVAIVVSEVVKCE